MRTTFTLLVAPVILLVSLALAVVPFWLGLTIITLLAGLAVSNAASRAPSVFWSRVGLVSAVVAATIILRIMVAGDFWFMLAVTFLLAGLSAYNGLAKIPAEPPHKAVLVWFGERQEIVLSEGWNFFPLYPLVFGFVLVKVEKVSDEIPKQEVRTPDRALVTMTGSAAWTPGIPGQPNSYITYLNSGGEAGVKKIIHNVIEDRTKTWASSDREGPSGWEEAQALRDDAHAVLAKALLGSALAEITTGGVRSPIPTSTWMRFFDTPQSEPTSYDCADRPGSGAWAFRDSSTGRWNWDVLQDIYDTYSQDDQDELTRGINQRRQDIKSLREGTANFPHPSLGITIHQFTVNELMVGGAVATAADQAEKEKKEQEADTIELKNVSDRIAELRKRHRGMSLPEAVRLVQTERGKISKSVIEVLGASTGVTQDILAALGVQKLPGGGNPISSSGDDDILSKDPAAMSPEDYKKYVAALKRRRKK